MSHPQPNPTLTTVATPPPPPPIPPAHPAPIPPPSHPHPAPIPSPFPVTDTSKGEEDARVTAEFSTECGKLQHTVNGLGAAELRTGRYQPGDSTAPAGGGGTVLWPIRSAILGFAEEAEVDVLVMGSAELAHADKKHTLGSICAAVAKETRCHFCVVKNTSISA